MKLWQKLLVYPLLAIAAVYWYTLLALFVVLSYPADKVIKLWTRIGVPVPLPRVTEHHAYGETEDPSMYGN